RRARRRPPARADVAPRVRVEGGGRRARGSDAREGQPPRYPAGGIRTEGSAPRASLRRVLRERGAGSAGLALRPLPDLLLPVLGRGAGYAADGSDGVRRRTLHVR